MRYENSTICGEKERVLGNGTDESKMVVVVRKTKMKMV